MNALVKPYSKATEEFLEDLATELEVPKERYEAAERSYKSVGEWLQREDSSLMHLSPNTSVQGSFRLGTVIGLKSGHIRAAGLDVYDGEPKVNPGARSRKSATSASNRTASLRWRAARAIISTGARRFPVGLRTCERPTAWLG